MFGCVVAGRAVIPEAQLIAPGKFLFRLDSPSTINHLVIFLNGSVLFDNGQGASIFVNTDEGIMAGREWKYLGVITSEKPSAIFKLSSLMQMADAQCLDIGISLESIPTLEQVVMENSSQLAVLPSKVNNSSSSSPLLMAQKLGESLFNYITSFARPSIEMTSLDPQLSVVPVKVVQDWFNGCIRKVTSDPDGFLRQMSRSD